MNYFYVSIYVCICIIMFFIIFMGYETFMFLFEKYITPPDPNLLYYYN
jgi:hypothetical protein